MDLDCDITYFEVGVVLLINQTCKHCARNQTNNKKENEQNLSLSKVNTLITTGETYIVFTAKCTHCNFQAVRQTIGKKTLGM